MKPCLTQIALCLRALRKSRHQTQESLAARCEQYGFPVSRSRLAKYEIGLLNIPAQFIPIAAHVLSVDVTDLLPPIGGQSKPNPAPIQAKIRNLTGQQIQTFRRNRKWSQSKLAGVIRKMGTPMTREIIANLETRRTRVKDYELLLFAKALEIPMDSLFPGSVNHTEAAHVFNRYSSLENPFPDRRNKAHSIPSPFARIARKIGSFAKRLIARR
jgi:transcriptional regulator with XRE-family HTH domain